MGVKKEGKERSVFLATVCAQHSLDCLPAIRDLLEMDKEEIHVLMFCCFESIRVFL